MERPRLGAYRVDLGRGLGLGAGCERHLSKRGSVRKDLMSAVDYVSLVFLKINKECATGKRLSMEAGI